MGVSYMKQFGFLARNAERFAQQLDLGQAVAVSKVNRGGGREAETGACWANRPVLCPFWGDCFSFTSWMGAPLYLNTCEESCLDFFLGSIFLGSIFSWFKRIKDDSL